MDRGKVITDLRISGPDKYDNSIRIDPGYGNKEILVIEITGISIHDNFMQPMQPMVEGQELPPQEVHGTVNFRITERKEETDDAEADATGEADS